MHIHKKHGSPPTPVLARAVRQHSAFMVDLPSKVPPLVPHDSRRAAEGVVPAVVQERRPWIIEQRGLCGVKRMKERWDKGLHCLKRWQQVDCLKSSRASQESSHTSSEILFQRGVFFFRITRCHRSPVAPLAASLEVTPCHWFWWALLLGSTTCNATITEVLKWDFLPIFTVTSAFFPRLYCLLFPVVGKKQTNLISLLHFSSRFFGFMYLNFVIYFLMIFFLL